MRRHGLCVLLVAVTLVFASSAEAKSTKKKEPGIAGLWSKVEAAMENATAKGFPALEREAYSYVVFSPTPDSKIFTFTWVNLVAAGNFTDSDRANGPTLWAPLSGANVNSYGMAVKTGPYTYDIVAALPFTSGTGVISDNGKQMALYAIGQGKRGGSGPGLFPGLHRISSLKFPKAA